MIQFRARRSARSWLVRATPLLAAVALVATSAAAHGRRDHERRDHDRHPSHAHRGHRTPSPAPLVWGWHGPVNQPRFRSFVVPTVIVASDTRRLRQWRQGHVYDPTHHHRHAIYAFPVVERGVWVSRPHAYCDGHLVSVPVPRGGPGFGFALGFGF